VADLPKPIVSTRSEDPDCEERIDAFVIQLGPRVDAFQDAELGADLRALRDLAEALAADAEELGYPALVDAAQRIGDASGDSSADAVHKAVEQLTEISQRVRRGHRSAAG
jgi:hypothetical protein